MVAGYTRLYGLVQWGVAREKHNLSTVMFRKGIDRLTKEPIVL
jgi:hypothetical protein